MRVGVPREVKNREYRVALTPAGVTELVRAGHEVLIERGAGEGSSIPDADFVAAGARIVAEADDVWADADLLLKVKEPIAEEHQRLRRGQTLFTYLHLAASKECTDALVGSGTTAIAYETVQTADGALPLLAPMSEVAGRMAPQVGAHSLERAHGGRGVLLGGVSGVYAAKVVVLDRDIDKLRSADRIYQGHLQTVASNAYEVEQAVLDADLVIGAVLVPGAKAPTLVSNDLVGRMKPGSVLVDIAVDQGGCFEDTRPTTHDDPTFRVHGSVFYCVANMPGAVPNTSTHALTNVTLPYVMALANEGTAAAVAGNPALAHGVNVVDGQVVLPEVAEAHGMAAVPLQEVLR
jgi:alanine dehydrogenase